MKIVDQELFRRVVEFIHSNLQKDLSVKNICSEFGINRNKLQTGFRMLFGVTVHTYIIKQKMLHAAERLRSTDDPIKTIASDYYCRPGNFHINFKKAFGFSPEEFRKKGKTNGI